MNLYAYVANDPVNATDPTGEFANILIGGAIGAVVGAAIEKVTNPNATKESIARAAAVGAAAGALGPAGGTAVRAALVGKTAANASKVSKAIPSGKALVTTTDLAADVAGQPVLGAVDAALQGQDPALGALEGVGAAGGAGLAEAGTAGGGSTTRGAAGARGAAAALGKTVAKQIVKAGAAAAGSNTSEQVEQPRVDEELD